MEYYAGKLPPFESRPVVPLARRVRFNDVTGFYEVLGGDEPPQRVPDDGGGAHIAVPRGHTTGAPPVIAV